MSVALWLAWSELSARRRQFIGSAALVGVTVALLAGTELVSSARDSAIASEIAYLGPSVRVVPAGITATQLTRFELDNALLSTDLESTLRAQLSGKIWGMEGRLLRKEAVDGVVSPIVGLPFSSHHSMVPVEKTSGGGVLLGSELARRLQRPGRVTLLDREWPVAGVLPPLGTADDLALFVSLDALQETLGLPHAVNEIRIYARPDVATAELTSTLLSHRDVRLHAGSAREKPAELETRETLSGHRSVIYLVTALVVALGLLIIAYINAAERRIEMATLVAIGCSAHGVLLVLASRSGFVGLTGAILGYSLGIAVAFLQDPSATLTIAWSWSQPLAWVAAATALSVASALPVALHSAVQEHARALQV